MEELIHYVWKHKIFPLRELFTTSRSKVEVIDPGLHNFGSGPDFFNAKIRIDGQLWVGNVEIHVRASDWFRHHHDTDPAYDNVILHVVEVADVDVPYPGNANRLIPQMVLPVPGWVRDNYDSLIRSDSFPPCAKEVPSFPRLMVHSWLSALQVERLEDRSCAVTERSELLCRDWETTFFVTIARNFGFGKNGDAFEMWAKSFPLIAMGKHRDSLFQIEAVFFGQAGLLNDPHDDYGDYYVRLRNEYMFMRHKFSFTPIDPSLWTHKVRPENFPEVRLAQIAMLFYRGCLSISKVLSASTLDDIYCLLMPEKGNESVSDYWHTHFAFRQSESPSSEKRISKSSVDLIVMNSIVPFLFAYGRYKGDDELCDRSFDLMEGVKPEKNKYITQWAEAGIQCQSAADSQALIQLSKNYCEKHNCLRCRFGYEYIKRNPSFLAEDEQQQER